MKISKYAKLVKTMKCCSVTRTPDGMYLSTGASVYLAKDIQPVKGRKQLAALLDIDTKKMDKIRFYEEDCKNNSNVNDCDLSCGEEDGDIDADVIRVAATVDGMQCEALVDGEGEILFYSRTLLEPLNDVLEDEDEKYYIQFAVRKWKKTGGKYIIVRDGFDTIAAISPLKILSDDYMEQLQDFCVRCGEQLRREKEQDTKRKMEEAAVDGVQTTLFDAKRTTKQA